VRGGTANWRGINKRHDRSDYLAVAKLENGTLGKEDLKFGGTVYAIQRLMTKAKILFMMRGLVSHGGGGKTGGVRGSVQKDRTQKDGRIKGGRVFGDKEKKKGERDTLPNVRQSASHRKQASQLGKVRKQEMNNHSKLTTCGRGNPNTWGV